MTKELLKQALDALEKVPTLTHGVLVRLSDVERVFLAALELPPTPEDHLQAISDFGQLQESPDTQAETGITGSWQSYMDSKQPPLVGRRLREPPSPGFVSAEYGKQPAKGDTWPPNNVLKRFDARIRAHLANEPRVTAANEYTKLEKEWQDTGPQAGFDAITPPKK